MADPYVPTSWVDNSTPVNAANMNKIEAALDAAAVIVYKGDWAAGTYYDGEVVVLNGQAYMCVGGPTAVAPDPAPWGLVSSIIPPVVNGQYLKGVAGSPAWAPISTSDVTGLTAALAAKQDALPAVVNNKWLRGQGGAMVWDSPVSYDGAGAISAANTDIPLPDPADVYTLLRKGVSGGSLRSIGIPLAEGTRVDLQNYGGANLTLLHNVAGGSGAPLFTDTAASTILPVGYTANFVFASGIWLLVGISQNLAAPSPSVATTLPATPYDGQEATLVDSLTAPTYSWRFKYVLGIADANKWIFVGGAPVVRTTLADEATASSAYVDLGSVTFTVPRAGIYRISHGHVAGGTNPARSIQSVKLGAAATSDNDSDCPVAGSAVNACFARTLDLKTLAASDVVKVQYRSQDGTAASFQKRWMEIIPSRVA